MAGEAIGGRPLCRGLARLKRDWGELKVDEKLLDTMQKWGCLTPRHVESLLKKPEAERLNSMMYYLEHRTPSKWGLLVCVFLETRHDKMAKSSWYAVQEHLKGLLAKKEQKEALDIWATFVRQMSVLVRDQEALDLVAGEQQKTASEIWEAILEQPAESTYHDEDEMNMWKILVSSVTAMLKDSEPATDHDIWKGLVNIVLTRMRRGKGKKAILMYTCLVEKAKTVAFRWTQLQHILKIMVEFMLEVQDSSQRHFVDDVRKVLAEHLQVLYALDPASELQERKTARYLFHRLIDSIPDLLKKGAQKTAKDLWKDLVHVQQRLQDALCDTHVKTREALCSVLRLVKEEELASTDDLERMHALLPSRVPSMELQPCSTTDVNDDNVPSFSAQLNVSLIESNAAPQSDNLALVINNVDFRDGSDRRDGSEMDELALPGLLKDLGFHVQQETNLTQDELRRAIAIFADRPEHASADMAVLAVMTHGVNEALVGVDGEELSFQAVVDCFSNETAPNLAGKPKWLIFQACRKRSEETNHVPDGSRCSDDPRTRRHVADIFITHTALPSCSAIRNRIEGTWYVQALKDVFHLPQAHTLSLFELHMKVQEVMTGIWKREMVRETRPPRMRVPEPKLEVRTLGWKKKIFFNQYASRGWRK